MHGFPMPRASCSVVACTHNAPYIESILFMHLLHSKKVYQKWNENKRHAHRDYSDANSSAYWAATPTTYSDLVHHDDAFTHNRTKIFSVAERTSCTNAGAYVDLHPLSRALKMKPVVFATDISADSHRFFGIQSQDQRVETGGVCTCDCMGEDR